MIGRVESSYFDDPRLFPAGTAVLDGAFVLRDVAASWRAVPALPVLAAGRRVPVS